MTNAIINVVFKPRSSLLDIIDVADARGWTEAQRFARGARQLEEVIYELPDGDTVVRGIDDHFMVVVFASITGPNRTEAEHELRSGGAALAEETLWNWAEGGSPQERSFSLRALAAISEKTADSRVVDLYTKALGNQHPDVRKALIEAVGRAAWSELWPVVDELNKARSPESETLRRAYEAHLPRP